MTHKAQVSNIEQDSALTPASMTLNFIHIPNPKAGPDRNNQRLVKSHVMKQVHAVKRLTRVGEFQRLQRKEQNFRKDDHAGFQETTLGEDSPDFGEAKAQKARSTRLGRASGQHDIPPDSSILGQQALVSIQPYNRVQKSETSSLHQGMVNRLYGLLGAGRVDPFMTYPLPTSDVQNFVIDYYITVITPAHDRLAPPRFQNNNILSVWLPNAISSPIMFASMLMTASRALAGRYPNDQHGQHALQYKAFVLRLLRESMTSSSERTSDETLAALVSIKWEEFGTGDMVAYDVHDSAITAIVKIRGGLECLGMKGVLAHVIKSHDLGKWRNFLPGSEYISKNVSDTQSCAEKFNEGEEKIIGRSALTESNLPPYYELMLARYQED